MTTISRLDTAFPEISSQLKRANIDKQREVVAEACAIAIKCTGLEGEEVHKALQLIRINKTAEDILMENLDILASDFDDEYFKLDEIGDRSAIIMFSKARTVCALKFALCGTSENLNEALYEALSAVEDPAIVLESIKGKLG